MDAYQTLMTRDRPPAALAGEGGCIPKVIRKVKENIVVEVAAMRLYLEIPAILDAI